MTAYVVRDLRPTDHEAVYRFLSEEAYWSKGQPREIFDRAIANSLHTRWTISPDSHVS